jgi:hypothetical protein
MIKPLKDSINKGDIQLKNAKNGFKKNIKENSQQNL